MRISKGGLDSFPAPALAAPSNTEQGAESIALPQPGGSLTHALPANSLHSYSIFLRANQYISLVFEQQAIFAVITLYGSDGSVLLQIEGVDYQPKALSWIARTDGPYRVEVRPAKDEQTSGRYSITVETIRPSSPADESRINAEQLVAAGERLQSEWKAESSRRALERLKESLPAWRLAQDARGEAQALKRMGDVYQSLGDFQEALNSYERSLMLNEKLHDRRGESRVLSELCMSHVMLGENQKAMKHCVRALELSKATADLWAEGQALNNTGEVYNWLGQIRTSLDFYYKALPLWVGLNDRRGMAQTYMYLGFTYSDLGQPQKAFDFFNKALPLWQSANDRRGQSSALTATGRLYSRLGESQKALDFFEKARNISQLIGDPIDEARILTGIAYVYGGLGRKPAALDYYNKALALYQRVKYLNGVKVTLYGIGNTYYSLGDYEKALSYYRQDLELSKAINDNREQSYALQGIGLVYTSRGDRFAALDNFQRAVQFYKAEKDLRGEADTLNLIGGIYEKSEQAQKAIDYYARAAALCQLAEHRVGEATSLYNLARVERDHGRLTEARYKIQAALKIVESLRTKVTSQDSRASYSASIHQYYELHIDVMMQLHKNKPTEDSNAAAFEASERARARSLLESLKEAQADIREGVDASLLERERVLQQTLNARAERHARLLARATNDSEAASVAKEIDQLTNEYENVEAQIRTKSPRYAALTQPQPLSLSEIQQQLLDDNTLLLEYMLGDERSYVWAVTRTGVSSFELAGRAKIEEAALRFYKLMTAYQPVPGETLQSRQQRVAEGNANLPEAEATLSKLVLGQLTNELGRKRLLIVPDGALQYVPFQALTVPGRADGADDITASEAAGVEAQIPLMLDHEIVYEPSASALALVLSESAQRTPASKTIAVLANPVFEADDPRVKSRVSAQPQIADLSQQKAVQEAFRDAAFGQGLRIPPLPGSREEANAIIAIAPWRSGFKAEGFEASRATITRSQLGQYGIVHFATHGFVDYEHPELSGLVLSLVDENGQAQDGFLRLHDIYNLKLPVDLVVLSACNTGLGKDVKGEGLIGLTRGFMYAGAGGVAASLWKVDDEATAELMINFYQGMFKRGLTPAAALREAQLSMWRQKRWHAPYFWAAFVIQGQYNQHVSSGYRLTMIAAVAGVGILVSALSLKVFFQLRRRRRSVL